MVRGRDQESKNRGKKDAGPAGPILQSASDRVQCPTETIKHSNLAISSAVLRLLMSPSVTVTQSTV